MNPTPPILVKRSLVDLQKHAQEVQNKLAIPDIRAQVVLVMDVSGSMGSLFVNGTVKGIVTRILSLGMNLDDNRSIPVIALDSGANHLKEEVNSQNLESYVERYLSRLVGGSTNYAPSINKAVEIIKPGDPGFVLFVTDGANGDKEASVNAIREASEKPIFFQFLGISDTGGDFPFLRELDTLTGRKIDNAGFAELSLGKVTDQELFEAMLNEFPQFLMEAKRLGMLPWKKSGLGRFFGR